MLVMLLLRQHDHVKLTKRNGALQWQELKKE